MGEDRVISKSAERILIGDPFPEEEPRESKYELPVSTRYGPRPIVLGQAPGEGRDTVIRRQVPRGE